MNNNPFLKLSAYVQRLVRSILSTNNKQYLKLSDDGRKLISCNRSAKGEIVIPDGVTEIGKSAFYYCTQLTSVEISNSVSKIEEWAFCGCSSLTSIKIPSSVVSIGESAFMGCSNLTSIELSNSITVIGGSVFRDCTNLTSVEIPNSVTKIECSAFSGCSSLTSVVFPNSLITIEGALQDYCISHITGECPLRETEMIGSFGGAFEGCTSLTSIEIPDSVTKIGIGAFQYCTSIKKYIVDKGNPCYCTLNDALCTKDLKVLVCVPGGIDSFQIPTNVTKIEAGAFKDCISLTSIEIPTSVTEIGGGAFFRCISLTSIEILDSVTEIADGAFTKCSHLTELHLRHKMPLDFSKAFDLLDLSKITLYVPMDSGDDYRQHPFYSNFAEVIEE